MTRPKSATYVAGRSAHPMDWNLWIAITAVTLSGLIGMAIAPSLSRRPGLKDSCIAFAAGVLLVVLIVHVVPESLGLGHGSTSPDRVKLGAALVLAGFVGMLLLQRRVLKSDPCCGHKHDKHGGLPSYLALAACSINDGLILQHTVVLHPRDNVFAEPMIWAMSAHKLTAAFALVMLLKETSAGLSSAARMVFMLAFVAITPVVMLVATWFSLHGDLTHVVAFGAGALLYVVFGGMVPRVEHLAEGGKNRVLVVFLVGIAVTLTVELLAPAHSH